MIDNCYLSSKEQLRTKLRGSCTRLVECRGCAYSVSRPKWIMSQLEEAIRNGKVQTKEDTVQICETVLNDMKDFHEIYDYRIICDTSNNPSNATNGVVDVYIKPGRAVETISVTFTIS